MSRASAAVRFRSDGLVYTTLYNGTVGILFGKLVATSDLRVAWGDDSLYGEYKRTGGENLYPECRCGRSELVDIATDYGSGFHWGGTACRHCLAVIGPRDPFDAYTALDDHNRAGFGYPSAADSGDPLPAHLVGFEGRERGLPDWWPGSKK